MEGITPHPLFECPFSKQAEETLKRIVDEYGDKVRVVFRDYTFDELHPHARRAARLAREARAEKGDSSFWAAHDKLFASAPNLEDAELYRIGRELDLDADKVKSALSSSAFDQGLTEDRRLYESLQASGTPTFFINGRRLGGAKHFFMFKDVIDDEIVKATALRERGVVDVYGELTKNGTVLEPRVMAEASVQP